MEINTTNYKLGFWAGMIAFSSNLAFVVVQILQLLGVFTMFKIGINTIEKIPIQSSKK